MQERIDAAPHGDGQEKRSKALTALLVVSMVIWGGTWPSGKLVAAVAPFELTVFVRFLLTTAALLAVCLWRREPLALGKSGLLWALAGAVLMTTYNFSFLGGLRWGLAAKGGVIVTCLNPILTFAISAVAFRRRVRSREGVGLALGLAAGAVLIGIWKLGTEDLLRSGNLLFVAAAVSWSSLTVVSQVGQRRAAYLPFSAWVYGLSAAINVAILALRGFPTVTSSPGIFWANVVYLGIMGTAFATTVYFLAARRLGAHRAASFIYLVPVSALLLSWLLLGEVPDWITLAGGAVALVAVYLVNSAPAAAQPDDRAALLNAALDRGSAGALLSALGRRLSMPRGIVVQAGEAKRQAGRFDASAGIALSHRVPLHLSGVQRHLHDLDPAEVYSYSPTQGNPRLREKWRELLLEKNTGLAGAAVTLPTVVPGLTFGISAAADLFVDPGDPVLIPTPFWDNYELVFGVRRSARIVGYPLFDDADRLSIRGLRGALARAGGRPRRKAVLLFNFPHNPSGYSPTEGEAEEIAWVVRRSAERGTRIVAITDDAYFGLAWETSVARESLFSRFAALHENVLAVKVDGTTKEDLAWGFRIAFVTFGGRGLDGAQRDALEEKLMGELRSTVSSTSTPAQTLLLKALEGGEYRRDKAAARDLLEARYRRVRSTLDRLVREHPGRALPLPYNSGYFVCLRLPRGGADAARRRLLEREGIGTIAFGDELLRVAYAAVDIEGLEPMLEAIYRTLGESGGGTT
jgi:aspartate/methionine/tyrosine aminotransferase/drug/metabolite transporter (DMT)-like permease